MPADRGSHSNHRRTSTDEATRQREQELRRARGEIACVECQRLKLKCDRKVPCASCIRRNRAAMCPNGHAWSDQATRTLLSDTAQLHRKLSEMSQRIRQLEDALEISHSANSTSHHPLLREELLAIKRGVGPTTTPANEQETDGPEGSCVEALGTMSISDRGVSRFIGRSGGGESLILLGEECESQASEKPTSKQIFSHFMSRRSDAWLLMPPHANPVDVLSRIETLMPSLMRASSLCETYLENFSWISRVVERPQIFEELLPSCYRGGNARLSREQFSNSTTCVHELALLLMIFATGALADLTLPPYNDEAEQYYQMALATLSCKPLLGAATLASVQAVAIMALYNAHCGRNDTLDLAGSLMSLAANLGVSMGLHRDVSKWHVCTDIAERRRKAFWELFTIDCWHNLANGKPPSFVLKYCDVKYSTHDSEFINKDGRKEKSYWRDRHQLSRIVYAVAELFSGVHPVKYSQILEIDRRISEHIPPPHLHIPPEGSSMEEDGPLLIMQRIIPVICGDGLLLYIHRGFFAKALLENPVDPLLSPYAHSYLATYRSALSILKVIREHYTAFPNLVSRFWSVWSHAFSATVIIGSIVIKGKNPDTVRAALIELNLAVGLFEKASQQCDRAKRSLPTLLRLREKAFNAARALSESSPTSPIGTEKPTNLSNGAKGAGEGDDELLIFTGNNRLVKPKEEHHEPVLLTPPLSTSSSAATPSLPSELAQTSLPDLGITKRDPSISRSQSQSRRQSLHQLQSHTNSPSESTLCATPERDRDLLGINADVPGAWSAWADQEALLINYLSSGADLQLAQTAAFAREPDPSAFMWAEMSNRNSPDAQGLTGTVNGTNGLGEVNGVSLESVDGHSQRQQSQSQLQGRQVPNFNGLFSSLDQTESSPFANVTENGLTMPTNQFQLPSSTQNWDMFF